jgi:hypothetical protein
MMCLDFEQPQFKDLEQADRASAHDQRVNFQRLTARVPAGLMGRVGHGVRNAQVHIRPDTLWAHVCPALLESAGDGSLYFL